MLLHPLLRPPQHQQLTWQALAGLAAKAAAREVFLVLLAALSAPAATAASQAPLVEALALGGLPRTRPPPCAA